MKVCSVHPPPPLLFANGWQDETKDTGWGCTHSLGTVPMATARMALSMKESAGTLVNGTAAAAELHSSNAQPTVVRAVAGDRQTRHYSSPVL